MRLLFGSLLLAVSLGYSWVNCLPQYEQNPPQITPQIHDNDSVIHPLRSAIQEDEQDSPVAKKTKDILEKIKEINIKHGYSHRAIASPKNDYLHIPSFYSKSKNLSSPTRVLLKNRSRQMQHPLQQPFINPILEYLLKNPINPNQNPNRMQPLVIPSYPTQYVTNVQSSNPPIYEEDQIPGHYIQRKIVHQQSILIPTMQSSPYFPQGQNLYQNIIPIPAEMVSDNDDSYEDIDEEQNEAYEDDYLESQTVNNVKNIVQQYPQQSFEYSPFPQISSLAYPPNIFPQTYNQRNYIPEYAPQLMEQVYYPQQIPYNNYGRQQMPFPMSEYFPIVIKNPFQMMFNAMTSMVEYGPQAQAGSCNKDSKKESSTTAKPTTTIRTTTKAPATLPPRSYYITSRAPPRLPKLLTRTRNNGRRLPSESLGYQLIPTEKGTEITIFNPNKSANSSRRDLIIDDLKIPLNGDISFGVRLPEVNSERSEREVKKPEVQQPPNQKILRPSQWFTNKVPQPNSHQPPMRKPSHPDPVDEEDDEDQDNDDDFDTKGIFAPSGNQREQLVTQDNSGSGVFIHKLKVRKGGVAIAGPGGIATAGSGGTAIVGPNGFAYTHPDSLAIAGSGTKVVAVEPSVNLSELVKNNLNGTRHGTNPRVGKVVAVGPVIYYNKG